jgi:hypothetical protein
MLTKWLEQNRLQEKLHKNYQENNLLLSKLPEKQPLLLSLPKSLIDLNLEQSRSDKYENIKKA